MISAFFYAIWRTVRRRALLVVAGGLDGMAVILERWACRLSDAADAVRAKA